MGMTVSEARSFIQDVAKMSISQKESENITGHIKGGEGRIGMTEDGKVFKFNTKLMERVLGPAKNKAMQAACDRLRCKLMEASRVLMTENVIGTKAGLKRLSAMLQGFQKALGVRENAEKPGKFEAVSKNLLDRKVTASILEDLVANSKITKLERLWGDLDKEEIRSFTEGLGDTKFDTMQARINPEKVLADTKLKMINRMSKVLSARPRGHEAFDQKARGIFTDHLRTGIKDEVEKMTLEDVKKQIKGDLDRSVEIKIGGKKYGFSAHNDDYDELFSLLESRFGKDTDMLRTVLSTLHQGILAPLDNIEKTGLNPLRFIVDSHSCEKSKLEISIGEKNHDGSVSIDYNYRKNGVFKIEKFDTDLNNTAIRLDAGTSRVETEFTLRIAGGGNGKPAKIDVEDDITQKWNLEKGASSAKEAKDKSVARFKNNFPRDYDNEELRAEVIAEIAKKIDEGTGWSNCSNHVIFGDDGIKAAIRVARKAVEEGKFKFLGIGQ